MAVTMSVKCVVEEYGASEPREVPDPIPGVLRNIP
jgi:hypothetical protein